MLESLRHMIVNESQQAICTAKAAAASLALKLHYNDKLKKVITAETRWSSTFN